jgi:hypothetical protein
MLLMDGRDCLDLLQRISTNDVAQLSLGNTISTVFVTEKGKILGTADLLKSDAGILLATDREVCIKLRAWIEHFIIMEDAEIRDVSDKYECYLIIGGKAHLELGLKRPSSTGEMVEIRSEDIQARVFHATGWHEGCSFALLSAGKTGRDWIWSSRSRRIEANILETFRIEQGIPAYGKELTDQVNPLEAGLTSMVSFTKGCYVGQEVIARLDTYKKVNRRLAAFVIVGTEDESLQPGLIFDGENGVGRTTSHCWSYRLGSQIALGFLKTNVDYTHLTYRKDGEPTVRQVNLLEFPVATN